MKKLTLLSSLFLFPATFGFLLFYYWPLLDNFYLSFFSWNMISPTMSFVSTDNYSKIICSPELYIMLWNSFLYLIFLLIFVFVLPYLTAYILTHVIKKGSNFYRSIFFLPSLLSLAVASILFVWIFNPLGGPISIICSYFDFSSPHWFKTPTLVILSISIIIGWKVFGYNMLVLMSSMLSVPKEYIEVAKLENASNWVIFRKIILPHSSSTAMYVFTITLVFGLQYVLVPVNMITQGGPDQKSSNIVYVIYQYAFIFFQTGKAAAFSVITIILLGIVLFIRYKYFEKKVYYEN